MVAVGDALAAGMSGRWPELEIRASGLGLGETMLIFVIAAISIAVVVFGLYELRQGRRSEAKAAYNRWAASLPLGAAHGQDEWLEEIARQLSLGKITRMQARVYRRFAGEVVE